MTYGLLLTILAGLMILVGFFFALGVAVAFTADTVSIVLLVIVPLWISHIDTLGSVPLMLY